MQLVAPYTYSIKPCHPSVKLFTPLLHKILPLLCLCLPFHILAAPCHLTLHPSPLPTHPLLDPLLLFPQHEFFLPCLPHFLLLCFLLSTGTRNKHLPGVRPRWLLDMTSTHDRSPSVCLGSCAERLLILFECLVIFCLLFLAA